MGGSMHMGMIDQFPSRSPRTFDCGNSITTDKAECERMFDGRTGVIGLWMIAVSGLCAGALWHGIGHARPFLDV